MLPRETVCNDMFVMTQAKTGIYGVAMYRLVTPCDSATGCC